MIYFKFIMTVYVLFKMKVTVDVYHLYKWEKYTIFKEE